MFNKNKNKNNKDRLSIYSPVRALPQILAHSWKRALAPGEENPPGQ